MSTTDLRLGVSDLQPVVCNNCNWIGLPDNTKPIKDLEQRILPGEEVPVGECPRCEALCHLIPSYADPRHNCMTAVPLTDENNPADEVKTFAVVECSSRGVFIRVVGYGDAASQDGHGEIAFLELHDNKLQIHLFPDINSPEPRTISLEGARNERRQKEPPTATVAESN